MSPRLSKKKHQSARIASKKIQYTYSAAIALAVVFCWTFSVSAGLLNHPMPPGEDDGKPVVGVACKDTAGDDATRKAISSANVDDPTCGAGKVGSDLSFGDGDNVNVSDSAEPTSEALEQTDELQESEKGLSLIPEPSTILMLVLAALAIFLWRRKW